MNAENNCIILGASGETGQSLLKTILYNCSYEKIVLINRRQIDNQFLEIHSQVKIEQKIVDFQSIRKFKDYFKGGKTVFCAIGSSLSKASKVFFHKSIC